MRVAIALLFVGIISSTGACAQSMLGVRTKVQECGWETTMGTGTGHTPPMARGEEPLFPDGLPEQSHERDGLKLIARLSPSPDGKTYSAHVRVVGNTQGHLRSVRSVRFRYRPLDPGGEEVAREKEADEWHQATLTGVEGRTSVLAEVHRALTVAGREVPFSSATTRLSLELQAPQSAVASQDLKLNAVARRNTYELRIEGPLRGSVKSWSARIVSDRHHVGIEYGPCSATISRNRPFSYFEELGKNGRPDPESEQVSRLAGSTVEGLVVLEDGRTTWVRTTLPPKADVDVTAERLEQFGAADQVMQEALLTRARRR